MKSVHESLILTTTGGLFSKAEVPMLYVQIQEEHDWEFLPTGMTTAL